MIFSPRKLTICSSQVKQQNGTPMKQAPDTSAQTAFNELIKNSTYLQSCLTAHRDGTAEVIASLIGAIVADSPVLIPKVVVALKAASDFPGTPSVRGERARIIEQILQALQQSASRVGT
jgi:hypothetical protein